MVQKYRSDIDGLRAIAVIAVLLYHYGFGISGGYVGVDVFFVISGYLITGTIINDLNNNRFSFSSFIERRVRRILPASVLVTASTLAAGFFIFLPSDFKDLGKSAMAQAAFLSNYYFWSVTGYFAEAAETKPLLHTWSLSVEEQYYLVFPAFVLVMSKVAPTRLLKVSMLVFCGSLLLSEYLSFKHPSFNYYSLATRAWEILLGSILALIMATPRKCPALARELAGLIGILLVCVPMFMFNEATRFPGFSALIPCIGAAAIIWSGANDGTTVSKALSLPALVFVGLISYSLYLWHWPLLAFANYLTVGPLSPYTRLILAVACVAVSILSWRWVETPFRKKAFLVSRRAIFKAAAVASFLLFASGAGVAYSDGFPWRVGKEVLAFAEGYEGDRKQVQRDSYRVGLDELRNGQVIQIGSDQESGATGNLDVLLWGDSHAAAILPALDELCNERGIRGAAIVYAATFPVVEYENKIAFSMGERSADYSAAAIAFIQRERPKHVLLAGKWHSFTDIGQQLIKTIDLIQATGAKVWILKSVPVPGYDVPRSLAIATQHGMDIRNIGIEDKAFTQARMVQNNFFEQVAHEAQGVKVLDPVSLFPVVNGKIQVELNGDSLYCDDSHLSKSGAMLLKPLLGKIWDN